MYILSHCVLLYWTTLCLSTETISIYCTTCFYNHKSGLGQYIFNCIHMKAFLGQWHLQVFQFTFHFLVYVLPKHLSSLFFPQNLFCFLISIQSTHCSGIHISTVHIYFVLKVLKWLGKEEGRGGGGGGGKGCRKRKEERGGGGVLKYQLSDCNWSLVLLFK